MWLARSPVGTPRKRAWRALRETFGDPEHIHQRWGNWRRRVGGAYTTIDNAGESEVHGAGEELGESSVADLYAGLELLDAPPSFGRLVEQQRLEKKATADCSEGPITQLVDSGSGAMGIRPRHV